MEKKFEVSRFGFPLQDLVDYRSSVLKSEDFHEVDRVVARFTQLGICTFKDYYGDYYITEAELQRIPSKIRAYAKTLKKQTRVRGRYSHLIAVWEQIIVPDTVKLLRSYRASVAAKMATKKTA